MARRLFTEEEKFLYLDDLTKVSTGYAGIPEPIADGPVADDETALVLMPGLAFDPQGHRIGYGGGFYDKFLAAEPNHPTLALCYEFQLLPELDTEEHDIPVDTVLWRRLHWDNCFPRDFRRPAVHACRGDSGPYRPELPHDISDIYS